MKRKSIFIFCLIILCYFIGYHSVTAAIIGGTGSLQASGGSAGCTAGAPCYTTNVGGDFTHIGLRFTLIKRDSGEKYSGSKSVTLLTDNLQNQLNALDDNLIYYLDTNSGQKMDISLSNWYDVNSGAFMYSAKGSEIISKASFNDEGLSWYINETFGNVQIQANTDSKIVYNKIFGEVSSGYNIIENYNSDLMGNVFGEGNSDKTVFAYIVNAMLGVSDYKDISKIDTEILPKLRDNGVVIEIQIVGLMDLKAPGGKRFILFGSSGELRAMTTQILADSCQQLGSDACPSAYVSNTFNVGELKDEVIKALFSSSGNAAITQMNRQFNAIISINSKPLGNDDYCKTSDWIESDQYSCGVGIIDILDLVPDSPKCTIVEEEGINKFYGQYGNLLNDEDSKPAQAFVNECLCNVDVTNGSFKADGESLYNQYKSIINEDEYVQQYCYPHEEVETETCDIKISDTICSGAGESNFSVGYIDENGNLNDDCIFDEKNINKTVLDNSTDKNNLTYQTNEYCSLTCAEKIDFKLPGPVGAVKAGTYWQWNSDQIEVKGTRKCQATVAVDKFRSDVGTSITNSNVADRVKNIYTPANGDTETAVSSSYSYDSYSLRQQAADLKTIYNTYKNLSKSAASETSDTSGSKSYCASRQCNVWGNCWCTDTEYVYCRKYEYKDSNTGETFYYYEADEDWDRMSGNDVSGNCSGKNTNYENSAGETPSEVNETIKEAFNKINERIERQQSLINACTETLDEGTSKNRYDFNPVVTYSYADGTYNEDFGGNTKSSSNNRPYVLVDQTAQLTTNNSGSYAESSISYDDDIDSNSTATIDYYTGTNNNFTYVKTNKYESSVYFYLQNADFNKGVLKNQHLGTSDNVSTNLADKQTLMDNLSASYYLLGNVYPVSLNETGTNKIYNLYFSGLGIERNGQSGNRFNQELGGALQYTCYYDIDNDVTDPLKPEFFFRNVSLNNFDPNNRKTNGEMGKNWTSTKGRRTQCEIEGKVWDEENDTCNEDERSNNPEQIYEKPEYSFTLTPENIANIKSYNDAVKDFGNFRMSKVGSSVTDENDNELSEGLWYTSDFIRLSTECSNCFTVNNDIENEVTWTKWTEDVKKLSGTGPAWK